MNKPNLFLKAVVSKPKPSSTGFTKARTEVKICFSDGTSTADGRVIEPSAIETLIASLPGTPIVGIYDQEKKDFKGHFDGNSHKERFGFVPNDVEGEIVEDENGQEWLVAEVVIWTNYEGAEQIFGSSQSLEIDENSYEGAWKEDAKGNQYFAFTKAEFKALCVLGADVEPAYTGSGFGEQQDFKRKEDGILNEFKQNLDEKARDILAAAELKHIWVLEQFEDALIILDLENDKQYRLPFSVTEDGTISVGEKVEVKYYAISTEEEANIDKLRAAAAEFEVKKGEWEVVESELKAELSANRENFEKQKSELESKAAELKNKIVELTSANSELQESFESLAATHKADILKKYDGVFETAEIETLQNTPMAEFKATLGALLVEKEVGVKVANFAAVIPQAQSENLPAWAQAVKENK